MISLFLNGVAFDAESSDLKEVLIQWQSESKSKQACTNFAVAVNQNFIPKSHYANTQLCVGDKLEILTPMQGG